MQIFLYHLYKILRHNGFEWNVNQNVLILFLGFSNLCSLKVISEKVEKILKLCLRKGYLEVEFYLDDCYNFIDGFGRC